MKTKINNIEEEIEGKVIDEISLGALGRLVISKPEKKFFGEDLLIRKRADYEGENIFVKVCSLVGPTGVTKLSRDFLAEELKIDKNFYLLFVYFDTIKQKIGDSVWLIPTVKLQNMAGREIIQDNKKILRVEVLLNSDKKDKYSDFLIPIKDLWKSVLELLSPKKN